MPTFTVHEPPPRKSESVASPERFVFVRDGFYFWAFVLAPLWLLVHRLWLALVGLSRRECRVRRRALPDRRAVVGEISRRLSDRAADRLRGGDAVALDACRGAAGRRSASSSAKTRKWRSGASTPNGPNASRRSLRRVSCRRSRNTQRRCGAGRRRRPMSSACSPSREASDERRHCRLRLGQSALGGESLRARRARERPRSADRGDQRSRRRWRAPTAWCCRASALSPIAGAGSTTFPA